MSEHKWISELFESIDEKNIDTFLSFLSEDCSFRFGNLPEAHGIEGVREFVSGFFDSIETLKHDISDIWVVPGNAICHGIVTYTRHDKSILSIPFSNIFRIENNKVSEYLIFADTSRLYTQ